VISDILCDAHHVLVGRFIDILGESGLKTLV